MSQDYRVAFIGCGRIAKLHINGYKRNEGCKVVALVDVKPEVAEEFAETHELEDARLYTDYREMLEVEKPDIVSVCVWTGMHPQVVRDCLKAGVPAVHCEKPMAPTWGEAKEMAAFCEASDSQVTISHQRRFLPVFRKAKELLDEGAIGDLLRVEAYNPENILDWGTHVIDLIFMFNDEVPARWVMGQIDARECGEWFDIPYEYAALGLIRFENGVRAIVHSGADKEMRFGVRLEGTDGMIEIRNEEPYLRMWGKDHTGWQVVDARGGLHTQEDYIAITSVIADVIKGLETDHVSELVVSNAVQTSEVIFSIYESSRCRSRVDLPLKITDSPFLTMLENGDIGPEPSS